MILEVTDNQYGQLS